MRALLGLLVLVPLGCGRTTEPNNQSAPPATASVAPVASGSTSSTAAPPASSTPAAADSCAGLFAPPPGAETLCDEHIRGQKEEIHFRSWATTEDRVDVNRRYQGPALECHFGVVTKPPIFSISKDELRLSTHEAGAGGYPTCSTSPKPTHKTVIVISSKTDFAR